MRFLERYAPGRTLPSIVFTALLLAVIAAPASAYLALLRQGVETADVPNTGDLFGYTVAAGDFNNDGRDDLAVASPWESNSLNPVEAHGIVTVNWGTSFGLRHLGVATLSPGVPLDNSVRFGWAMATGDFDGDGFDDLAVGIPGNNVGPLQDAGSVWIYEGFAGGIQVAPSLMFTQTETGGTAESFDNFGFTLATGDFDNNGYADLAVAAVGENGDTGNVTVVYSVGVAGLSTATAANFSAPTLGYSAGTAGGWFGKGLATGDLDQDGFDDLVIGAPKTSVAGIGSAGRVYVLYGSAVGVSTTDDWKFDTSDDTGWLQNTPLELGYDVEVGDFRAIAGNSPLQIVAGAPGYESGGQNDTGAFVLLSHEGAARSVGVTKNLYQQPTTPDVDPVQPGDRFGEVLAAGDFDADTFDDLAVGTPTNHITEPGQLALGSQSDAGSVHLYSSDAGVGFSVHTHITHKTLNDHVGQSDNLGRGLAFGRFDGRASAALAVGAPNADWFSYEGAPAIPNAGVVYVHAPWRQPRNRPHRGSAALDCSGNLIYAQRAWQRMRPASTTKTMTLKVACDALDQGMNPADPDTVPSWVANNVGGSQANHQQGDIVQFFDFFKTMMTVSGNDAAMWLGAKISGQGLFSWTGWSSQSPLFAAAMENQADDYGMSTATSFTNAAGIDSDDHYTTPYDFALMTFQAINDPCVKQIVDRPNWVVPIQRIGADGIPGQYGVLNLNYVNNFVNGVRDINPSTVGMKGGQTPGALRTGVYNSYVVLAAAQNGASGFGVWDDDDPVAGAVADCNGCIGAELMAIADLYCTNTALPDEITMPEPTPDPWAYLTGMSSAAEDTATGLVFNAEGSEANQLGRQIQVDVLRTNQALPTAAMTAVLRHTSEFCLDAGTTQSVGIAPYHQHDGFRITNRGLSAASLRVTASDPTGYDQTVTLLPDSAFVVAPASGNPALSFQLAVTNLEPRETACIEVEEIGYRTPITLGNGRTMPDVATFLMDRVPSADYDVWSLEFRGLDAAAGNLLDVSAHDPDGTADVGDDLPAAPRPVTSRLLPNVPNPFAGATTVRFDLTVGAPVDLRVFDVRGRVVRTLASGTTFARGRHDVRWDGRDDGGRAVGPGVYFVKLVAGGATDSWRMLRLR